MLNPNSCDRDGNTPLHIAAGRGLIEVVMWLCEQKGAKMSCRNRNNLTAFDVAKLQGNQQVSDYLLQRKRDLMVKYMISNPVNMPWMLNSI